MLQLFHFSTMLNFLCNLTRISFEISKSYGSINPADRSIIEILHPVISFKLDIVMTIISILLQFHLIISFKFLDIACIIPSSDCLGYFYASWLICDANPLAMFSAMRISIDRLSRPISNLIFTVNRIFLLLPVLRLVLIFYMQCGISIKRTPFFPKKVSALWRCPLYRMFP